MSGTEEKEILNKITGPLCAWYRKHHRILPWRENTEAYGVWVSEIMLQQTRVEAAKPYYRRFLRELPDLEALAACPEEKLLKLWEGLGYYSRVRNMQKAAQILVQTAPASLPEKRKELMRLPGIGAYTAGAVASIAYGEAVPAVDGNVLRILARLFQDERDVLNLSFRKEMDAILEETMKEYFGGQDRAISDRDTPGEFNQGLMDLGAAVCIPNGTPLCGSCPLADYCRAHANGRETDLPVRSPRKTRRIENRTVLLIRDGSHVVLQKRPDRGLLAGLYEFPNVEGILTENQALELTEKAGLVPLRILPLAGAKHVFSHVEWHMTGFEIRIAERTAAVREGRWIFAENARIERDYPIPSAFAAYAAHLQLRLGSEKSGEGPGTSGKAEKADRQGCIE